MWHGRDGTTHGLHRNGQLAHVAWLAFDAHRLAACGVQPGVRGRSTGMPSASSFTYQRHAKRRLKVPDAPRREALDRRVVSEVHHTTWVACSRMGELPVCQCGSAVTSEPHAADLQPDRPPWRADAAQYLPYTLLEAPAKSKTARGSRNRPRLESCGQLPLLLTSPN